MGFPVGYTELFLPRLFIHALSLLGFLRKFISIIFSHLGLPDFIEPDLSSNFTANNNNFNTSSFFSSWASSDPSPGPNPTRICELGSLIRELLPVVRFSELVDSPPSDQSCAVCLYEFEGEDEIRRLRNCCHIFHRACLDRWIGYGQKTCPLCRASFLSDDLISERLSLSNTSYLESEFDYSEYSQVNGL